jgi:hypothetical protein
MGIQKRDALCNGRKGSPRERERLWRWWATSSAFGMQVAAVGPGATCPLRRCCSGELEKQLKRSDIVSVADTPSLALAGNTSKPKFRCAGEGEI